MTEQNKLNVICSSLYIILIAQDTGQHLQEQADYFGLLVYVTLKLK